MPKELEGLESALEGQRIVRADAVTKDHLRRVRIASKKDDSVIAEAEGPTLVAALCLAGHKYYSKSSVMVRAPDLSADYRCVQGLPVPVDVLDAWVLRGNMLSVSLTPRGKVNIVATMCATNGNVVVSEITAPSFIQAYDLMAGILDDLRYRLDF